MTGFGPPTPHDPAYGGAPVGSTPGAGPPQLPPPVPYAEARRSWWLVSGAVVLVAAIAAGVSVWVAAAGSDLAGAAADRVTVENARPAIQRYLDALEATDIDTIARNGLCGLYDEVSERRSELQVAKLSSDAFRQQFTDAQVTSVDKLVSQSPTTAQALFTMSVTPARGTTADREQQGIASLLANDGEIFVCSYLLRSSGPF